MLHILGAFVLVACDELNWVVHELFGYTGYLFRHSGREHQHLTLFRHMLKYLFYIVEEAHVNNFVSLVEYDRMYLVEFDLAAFDKVNQTTRGGYNHLHTLAQRTYLAVDTRTAVDRQYTKIVDIFGKVGKIAGYLKTQFTCRSYNESLRYILRRINTLQYRQPESGRLARTGLCKTNDIAVFFEKVRYYHLLYGHRVFKTQLVYSPQQAWFDT